MGESDNVELSSLSSMPIFKRIEILNEKIRQLPQGKDKDDAVKVRNELYSRIEANTAAKKTEARASKKDPYARGGGRRKKSKRRKSKKRKSKKRKTKKRKSKRRS